MKVKEFKEIIANIDQKFDDLDISIGKTCGGDGCFCTSEFDIKTVQAAERTDYIGEKYFRLIV